VVKEDSRGPIRSVISDIKSMNGVSPKLISITSGAISRRKQRFTRGVALFIAMVMDEAVDGLPLTIEGTRRKKEPRGDARH